VEIANKTAIKNSPIIEGTVISRNPDGTLNVDDGKGGCLRQAPAANVRVGQRIRLGVEPALGQTTNLSQVSLTIDASTVPCPDDPRHGCRPTIGVPCVVVVEGPLVDATATISFDSFTVLWLDNPSPTFAESTDGIWDNRLAPITGFVRGGPQGDYVPTVEIGNGNLYDLSSRMTGSNTSMMDNDSPYANEVRVGCTRTFLTFDTSAIPPGAELVSATLRLAIFQAYAIVDDLAESVIVVPSDHSGVAEGSNFDKVFPTTPLASATLAAIVASDPSPPTEYIPFDFDLDVAVLQQYFNLSGVTKLALMLGRDATVGSTLPVAAPFTSPATPYLTHVNTSDIFVGYSVFVQAPGLILTYHTP
jgi:hypothetical protein